METNRRAIFLLLSANAISGLSQGICILAIPWYFFHHLQQPQAFGYLYFTTTIVSFFWGPYAGTLVDKHDRKQLFIFLNAIYFFILLTASLIGFFTGRVPGAIAALIFLLTYMNFNLHYPAMYAFAQEITPPKRYMQVNSLIEIQGQATSIIAGGIAAILLSKEPPIPVPTYLQGWELHHIFLLDAFTYAIAFFIVYTIQYIRVAERRAVEETIKERLKEGFRYLIQRKRLMRFGMLSYVVFATLIVQSQQLLPHYVSDYLKEDAYTYGFAELSYAIGALLAGVFVQRSFAKHHPYRGIQVLMIIAIAVYLSFAFSHNRWIVFLASLLIGISNAGTRILRLSLLFAIIPNHIIGRAGSIFQWFNLSLRLLFIFTFTQAFFVEHVQYGYLVLAFTIFVALLWLPDPRERD